VATLAEVAVKLEDCKRRDALRAEIARKRLRLSRPMWPARSERRASFLIMPTRRRSRRTASLKARAPLDDQTHAEAHSAYREAVKRLEAVGGDDAVARLDERRRTILEAVNDGARAILTLRAGLAAARRALRLFRDRAPRRDDGARVRGVPPHQQGRLSRLDDAPNGQSRR